MALDIDGTLTAEAHFLDSSVVAALTEFAKKDWKFIFITGRPFQWGYRTLQPLPFPYALAVQNGALLIDLPSKQILNRKYLSKDILSKMEKICEKEKTDFVVYSGLEYDDWCYYRPANFSDDLLSYMMERSFCLGEKWQSLQDFSQLPISSFSSVKCFVHEEQAFSLSQIIESELGLHAPPNRDPFNPKYFVIQATHAEATKGQVLQAYMKMTGITQPIIAAGDDCNDFSMLQLSDIKIVMANAPSKLLEIADVIAPPAKEQGIIRGLEMAMDIIKNRQITGELYD